MSGAPLSAGLATVAVLLLGLALRRAEVEGVRLRAGAARHPRRRTSTSGLAALRRRAGPQALVLLGALGGLVSAGVGGAAVGVGLALLVPLALRRREAARRSRLLEGQLLQAVGAVASAVRAGLSLRQALAYAADEVEPPLASSLRELVARAELGEPLEVTLERWAEDAGADVRLVAAVLRLHRRTGGDLPSVLDRLAATLRARRRAVGELRALTAQSRLSGTILGALPVAFFAFLGLTSRRDLVVALTSPAGRAAIGAGLVLDVLGFLWVRRIVRVGA